MIAAIAVIAAPVGVRRAAAAPAERAAGDKAPTEKEIELNARQAFAAARYDEAIELFARLYAETLNPIYLRNIGRCHQKKREPDKAIDAFHDYLAKGKSVSSAERKEIQGYIKEMEALRDQQAKEHDAQAKTAFVPAPPATAPSAPATAPGPASGPTTVVEVAPSSQAPSPYGGMPGAAAPAATGMPVLVSSPAAPNAEPNTGEEHPFYKRWWFWTAVGAVALGGVAAALLIPGGTTKPTCPIGDCR